MDNTTRFRNVDLDIFAKFDLQPLVAAFGEKVTPLYMGHERSLYSAHLELNGRVRTAEGALRAFITMIRDLPKSKRKQWDAAKIRDFNIGVQAATHDRPFEIKLAVPTLESVASLNARIVFTVYAPKLPRAASGLGTEIASSFKKAGLDKDIPELRGHAIKLPSFNR